MRNVASPRISVLLSILLILHSTAFAGVSFVIGQGVILTGADGVILTGADGVILTGADGVILTGADGVILTGADGVILTGADAFTYTGGEGVILTGADSTGLKSFDLELAMRLEELPNTSYLNVFVVYHRMPTDADIEALRGVGIYGGTRFRNLPIVTVNATKDQIAAISALASVRSIYSNKTLEFLTHDTRIATGQSFVLTDRELTSRNGGIPVAGQNVTVAVLDTGIDATHPDLAYGSHVVQNVRMADLEGSPSSFLYPTAVEGLRNTDPVMGHGTFVAGIIAGTGAASGGYYGGLAPGARMLGVSAGDANLFFVLSGIDYILSNRVARNIRVVNCSFGISGVFDLHDPVNIATKIMHDAGISVVFSAGNRGNQPNSLNPYSVAPWVVGVGSINKELKLSAFSSRGAPAYGSYHPTLVAPGEAIVSARATGINVVGASGLVSDESEIEYIPPAYLARYTKSSGTSFAAPHVAGTIALMLQANPALTPAQVKKIIQETATPMLSYSRYEVGAGNLNAYAAVRKAAFDLPFGLFRESLSSSAISFYREQIEQFSGEVAPGATFTETFEASPDTMASTIEIGWSRWRQTSNELWVTVERAGASYQSGPSINLAGKALKKSGVTINNPESGTWTITVTNTSDPATGSVQRFAGAVEVIRRNSSGLTDIGELSQAEQKAVKRAVGTGAMTTLGNKFSGGAPATRLEAARAILLGVGARVPQYVPYRPTFVDVPSDRNAVFVESLVRSPRGNLFGATEPNFYPQAQADRLTVAMASVKALGLEQEAQAAANTNPGITDWSSIPTQARGYVSVAITRNLMGGMRTSSFRPFDPITRTELAVTAEALQQASR